MKAGPAATGNAEQQLLGITRIARSNDDAVASMPCCGGGIAEFCASEINGHKAQLFRRWRYISPAEKWQIAGYRIGRYDYFIGRLKQLSLACIGDSPLRRESESLLLNGLFRSTSPGIEKPIRTSNAAASIIFHRDIREETGRLCRQ